MSPNPHGHDHGHGHGHGHGAPAAPKYRIVRHHHMAADYSHCPPAPFIARFIAIVIDGVFCGVVAKLAPAIVFTLFSAPSLKLFFEEYVASFAIVAYFTIAQSKWGFTVGKRLMHLKVVDARTHGLAHWGRVLYRETIGRTVCLLVLGLGYLVAAFGQKLAWHDAIAKTRVVIDKDDTDTAL